MNILQANTDDVAGGAANIAQLLHKGFRAQGHDSWIAVGVKRTNNRDIIAIENDSYRNRWARGCINAARLLNPLRGKFPGPGRLYTWIAQGLASPQRYWRIRNGEEDFDFPATSHLLEIAPRRPDVLHLHNLHGAYFDLRALPQLSHQVPVFMTLHDPWLLSGHCAHSFDCDRWKLGCGDCPDLNLYPRIAKDATAFNWNRKAAIYAASRLYVAASRWLINRIEHSMLMPGIREARVVPNGIDLSIFRPGDKIAARRELAIPEDCHVLFFTAAGGRQNPFKDYKTLRSAVERVAQRISAARIVFISTGAEAPTERIGSAEFRFVPFQSVERLVLCYQAADIYAHAAKVDTFPTTVLEAMACGTSVVATNVGGIPEQVIDGETGLLVPRGDPEAMAQAIVGLLGNKPMLRQFSAHAAAVAVARFGLTRMVDEYLNWYASVIEQHRRELP